jgi:exodeoxyribonuclease VII small subunit
LELALKKFEEGVELSKFCSQKLEETERRITLLMQDGSGAVVEKPFPTAVDEKTPD